MIQSRQNKKSWWGVLFVICILVVIMGMWMADKRTAVRVQWSAQTFLESSERLENRERGFYHLTRVLITDEEEQKNKWYEQMAEMPTGAEMVLLQINLQNYRYGPVSEAGMEQIRTVFQAYEEKNIDLIVRFLYDWDGNAMLSEPADIEVILGHMDQMREVMQQFRDSIYIMQGVFAGNWGEMNGSRHLTETSYLTLLKKLHEVVPESAFLAVRTPGYWRMAAGRMQPLTQEEAWQPQHLASRLSLYNDGIMGNELDYGTYGNTAKKDAERLGDHWLRKEELAFQNQLNLYVPNGGEVILDNPLNDLGTAAAAFKEMHVSYLNEGYDEAVLNKWKNSRYKEAGSVYDGMSGYDYIERHLGYRYVIRKANVKANGFLKRKLQISLELENVGFSGRYTACSAGLSLYHRESGQEIFVDLPDVDVRSWKPSESVKIKKELLLPEEGTYDLYLKITGSKRGETVWLANQAIGTEDGKYLLGTVTILQKNQ